ncbi:MAG TPA: hypothetical protein VG346_05305 [Acidimicrobiales bacterium]|jgi:hypothetical protein|nr:hypothetical protein [Acidimicrobiales bacterium]
MPIFGRKSEQPDPGEVTRVTAGPDISGLAGPIVVAAQPPAAGPEGEPNGATPVPTRLQRLAAVVDRARPGRSSRNVRKWLEWIGMALIVFGFVCILLGWYGAANSPFLYEEVPYLISGGLLGVALVIGGGVLVRCAWSMRQIEEERRNALAIVRSVDRLERILRSLDESRRTEEEEHAR